MNREGDLLWPMLCLFILAAAACLWFMLCGVARAHTAPEGWRYDYDCCSSDDCEQVADDGLVVPTDAGWLYTPTRELVAYAGDRRLRRSQDGHFHVCIVKFGSEAGKTRCLYVPSMGN